MFINISNLPSSKWNKEQLEAAKGLGGEIVDIPFPDVPALANQKELADIANGVVDTVNELMKDKGVEPEDIVFHIVGEFTLTVALVTFFSGGSTCVVSATKREIIENPDGTKSVTFNFDFIQFREYLNLTYA